MKKINTLYWIFTGLFAVAMIFSAISNIMVSPEAIDLISTQLGYPKYVIAFLGTAKLLGSLGILIPGLPRWVKEWSYAGLFFDLIGATFSMIAVMGFKPDMLGMLIFFGLGGLSYFYYHKRS